ncbi:MAG: bifunctional homocysteine S-methyltransferase/methylenetetrahydrofolate reductase, partial [Candidatus Neomarinimicrobiota bacterium]
MTFRDVWGKHLLVGDGALGTELEARQRGHTSCLEELNLQEPETVQAVHRDYLTAGADWIETNTFGANAARLRLHGLDDRLSDLVTGGVRLAREVCPAGKFVA